jgi:hypothetical protein
VRIEQAEAYVRQQLSHTVDETSNLRVRLLAGNRACIEVDSDKLESAKDVDWDDYFRNHLDFSSVWGIRDLKSGPVAATVNQVQRKKAGVTMSCHHVFLRSVVQM